MTESEQRTQDLHDAAADWDTGKDDGYGGIGDAFEQDEPETDPPLRTQEQIALDPIREAWKTYVRLRGKWETRDTEAKVAKKAMEAADEELKTAVKAASEELPLFTENPAEDAKAAEKDPESWRAIHISKLAEHGLSGAICEKLDGQGFHTIGDVANWTKGGFQLTDMDGIGLAKAEKIDKALECFWAAWGGKTLIDHVDKLDAEANGEAGQ